jgi:putative component of membrane protein insertase Oxa1/YidC/SpoIIIJ protein YidD
MRLLNAIKLLWIETTDFEVTKIEQDIAYQHTCLRELDRPDTSYLKFSLSVSLILIVGFIIGSILFDLIELYTSFKSLPAGLYDFYIQKPFGFKILFIVTVEISVLIFLSRIIIIEIIKLYQKYADEDIRRRCLFKPTCSEYTIMSLNKYGVIIGLYFAYFRVFKKCRGTMYRIDYP